MMPACTTEEHTVCVAPSQEGLWWLPLDAPHRNAVRKLLLLLALGAALGGLEGRVIFRAFGQYIWLQPPWSYVVVTLALYGSAALGILHLSGVQLFIV